MWNNNKISDRKKKLADNSLIWAFRGCEFEIIYRYSNRNGNGNGNASVTVSRQKFIWEKPWQDS